METQSAFMAAAAAPVLAWVVLRTRRDRPALLVAALIAAFFAHSAARGLETLGVAGLAPVLLVALAAAGSLAPAAAAALGRSWARVRAFVPLLLALPLAIAFALATPVPTAWLRIGATLWAATGLLCGTALLFAAQPPAARERSPDHTRLRYLAIAHAAVVLALALDLALHAGGGPRIATPLAALVYFYLAYLELVRLRVADLRQLLGNAIALSALALGLAGSFAMVWLWVGPQPGLFVFNSFMAAFLLLIVLDPVRGRIQRWVDRRFVAGRVELERVFAPLLDRLPQIVTLDEGLRATLEAVERADRLRASSLFLREDPYVGFQQAASFGLSPGSRVTLIRNAAFVRALERGRPLLLEDLAKERARLQRTRATAARAARRAAPAPGGRGPDATEPGAEQTLVRVMRELDAQLVLPLRADAQLVGFWTLSDVKAREPFSSSEVAFLQQVAARLAVTVENSRTFERVRARDRLAALGEMAAGLAHEIRNPLAAIRGAVGVLEGGDDPSMRAVIVEEIARLDRVVSMFLDYARPQAPLETLCDPESFVRDCLDSLERGRGADGVRVSVETEPGLPAVCASRASLERVLANLLSNAHDALAGRGAIRISMRRSQREGEREPGVEIAVADDGPGMDAATRERALIPFFSTKRGGTGLGLALCERLLRTQGGRIEIDSEPAQGTTVRIYLPSVGAPAPAGAAIPEGRSA
jgi:signal transduction histidine kinase